MVVRGEDGELRCFHNVCRHHAMSVASGSGNILDHDPSDKSREGCFTCPYHGWTYDTSGCLVKATRLTGIQGFSPAKYGLRPMRAMVWGHFVWVHLGAGGDEVLPGVGEWLGEVAAELEAGGAADPSLRFVERRNYLLRCNWKVFCDNYLDGGYHVPFAHPGLSSCVDMKSYSTDLFPGGHSVQSVRSDGSVSQPDLRLGSAACYGFVYPNFMVNRYGPWMDTNWAVPLGPDRCLVVFDYYLEEAMLEDSAFIKESLAASDAIQQEDTTLCHGVQEGVSSPGYGAGRYAPSVEAAMFHFHQSLHSDLVIRGS